MIEKNGKYWWNHTISMTSLAPNADGTLSGDIMGNGGFCYPGAWNCPVTNPGEGTAPTTVCSSAQDFIHRVALKLNKTDSEVKLAITSSLEDVYREQNATA